MNNKPHIFLVEDDLNFGAVLKSYLEINDFQVTWVDDGKYALDRFRAGKYNLCLLDVMLPHVDGFTIGNEIKKINSDIPVIFLTAKSMKEDILKGYNLGADDYITKPFDTEVLICKIHAVIKRQNSDFNKEPESFEIGSYHFDVKIRQVSRNENTQKLSPKEADLLKILCLNKNQLLSREIALKTIWGDDGYFTARSMDVFITKLRKYLADDPKVEIKNLHGTGFILEINQ
jgi:two-component system, OmpR family, response regulator